MTYSSKLAIYRMPAVEERKNRLAALRQTVQRQAQADIAPREFQSRGQRFRGVRSAARDQVNLGKVQVELRLVAFHAHGVVAEFFGFGPLAFGARQNHSEIRAIVGIVVVQFDGAAHVRQGLDRVVVPQKRERLLEFTEGFSVNHALVLLLQLNPAASLATAERSALS